MSNDRTPPQHTEAEKAVLGAILLNPSITGECIEILGEKSRDAFFASSHQMIYGAIVALFKDESPIDSVSIMMQLADTDALEDAGGVSYLAGLTSSVPTSANFEYYAKSVKEAALLRRIIAACNRIQGACYTQNGLSVEDIITKAQTVFQHIEANTGVEKPKHVQEVIEEVIADVDRQLQSKIEAGIPLPWSWWNGQIGGLPFGEFSMLMARPNVGKTAMMLNIAHFASQQGVPVFIISLEMDRMRLAKRLLSIDSGVDFKRIDKRFLLEVEIPKLQEGAVRVGQLSIWISDQPIQNAADIRAAARKFVATHGRGLVLCDYLQYVDTPRLDKMNIELGAVVKAFARIPKETECHLLSLGQLSRDADAVTTGYEKWLKGAGTSEIEKTADLGFVLHAPKAKEKKDLAATHGCDVSAVENVFHLTLAKNRNGPTGDNYLRFVKERQRFHEVTMAQPAPEADPNELIDEDEIPF